MLPALCMHLQTYKLIYTNKWALRVAANSSAMRRRVVVKYIMRVTELSAPLVSWSQAWLSNVRSWVRFPGRAKKVL